MEVLMRNLLFVFLWASSSSAQVIAPGSPVQVIPGDAASGGGSGGSPTGAAGGDLTGSTYPNPVIAPSAVTTAKILDATILAADFATGAVTSTVILDATILAADLATGAITTTAILDATILAADFAAGAVNSAAILDGTIIAADLASDSVTTAKILDSTIIAADLASDSVTTAKILDSTIIAGDLAIGAVTTTGILDGTIASADLNSATVTSTQIVGPASAADNECVRFDGTTGKLAQAGSGNCTISDAGLATVVGVTTTGAVTISGVTNDITTVSNQDLTLAPQGTGSVNLQSGDDITDFLDSAGTVRVSMQTTTASGRARLFAGGTNGALGFGAAVGIGTTNDTSATNIIACFADSISSASSGAGTQQFCIYGSGKTAIANPQTATCTSNGTPAVASTLTLDPTSSLVNVVNSDVDGCVITLSETSAIAGSKVLFILTSNAGGAVTFANTANVHAGPTFATTTGLGLADAYEVAYAATLLEYVGVDFSDN